MTVLTMLLPVISVISMGLFITKRLTKFLKVNITAGEYYVSIILYGITFLVIPATFIGLIFPGYLDRFFYLYEAFSYIYAIFTIFKELPQMAARINYMGKNFSNIKSRKLTEIQSFGKIFTFLFLIEYGIMLTIYPLRGWDALHFYFPHGFVFYLDNGIPAVNPLNFIPIFKPPLVSMYISFTYFVTGEPATNYFPFLFLTGITAVIRDIANKMSEKHELAPPTATLIFLSFPFTYFLVFEWAYYQELPITFAYITTFYGISKINFKKEKTGTNIFWLTYVATALSLAPLTKINGYALFFIYMLLIKGNKWFKGVKIIFVLIVTMFLGKRAATSLNAIVGITVLFLGALIIYLIYLEKTVEIKITLPLLLPLIIGFIPGLGWLYHIVVTVPGTKEFLITTYVKSRSSQLLWKWYGIDNPPVTTYIENAHTATLFSAIFILFTGSLFSLPWLFFKLTGISILRKTDEGVSILNYTVSYFMIWLAYYANGSARYLSVLLPSMAIMVAIGIHYLIKKHENRATVNSLLNSFVFLLLLGFGGVYPFYPFEYVFYNVHLRYYYFHKYILKGLLYAILFFIIIIGLYFFNHLNIKHKKVVKLEKFITVFLIAILAITPLSGQIVLLADTHFDINKFQTKWVYDYREDMLDLASTLQSVANPDEVTIGVNIPGLELFSKRPVLDIMTLANNVKKLPFNYQDLNYLYQRLYNNSVRFLVGINKKHDFYLQFLKQYLPLALFKYTISGAYGSLIYENPEFSLYRFHVNDYVFGPTIIGFRHLYETWALYQEIFKIPTQEEQPEGLFLQCYWDKNISEAEVSYSFMFSTQNTIFWKNNTITTDNQNLPTYISILSQKESYQIIYFQITTVIKTIDGKTWIRTWETTNSISLRIIEEYSPSENNVGVPTSITTKTLIE